MNMPEKKARIGFVGTGAMGQCAHLRNYVQLADRCEVVALAELRDDVRMRVASRYSSAGEMLAKESLDGIVASQPYSRHGVLLAELSKAGVPVFIEKPLSHSIEVGRKLLEHLERTGVSVMVGYHKRSDPATEYAREKIDEFRRTGELGPMRYVRVTMPPGDWISGGFGDIIDGTGEYPPLEHDPLPDDMDEENTTPSSTTISTK